MHEYGIVVNIVESTRKIVEKENISDLKVINVVIGKMNWIYPELLYDCFRMVTKGTDFEKTKLSVIPVEAVIKCKDCNTNTSLTEPLFVCSDCLSTNVSVISGNQLYIDSLEYEN